MHRTLLLSASDCIQTVFQVPYMFDDGSRTKATIVYLGNKVRHATPCPYIAYPPTPHPSALSADIVTEGDLYLAGDNDFVIFGSA